MTALHALPLGWLHRFDRHFVFPPAANSNPLNDTRRRQPDADGSKRASDFTLSHDAEVHRGF